MECWIYALKPIGLDPLGYKSLNGPQRLKGPLVTSYIHRWGEEKTLISFCYSSGATVTHTATVAHGEQYRG
jgi:hypothetical protein